jgi:hypothetical protein
LYDDDDDDDDFDDDDDDDDVFVCFFDDDDVDDCDPLRLVPFVLLSSFCFFAGCSSAFLWSARRLLPCPWKCL